jgi:hypothetical protein
MFDGFSYFRPSFSISSLFQTKAHVEAIKKKEEQEKYNFQTTCFVNANIFSSL